MVENNPHIEISMDNYEILYDLETWLLDLLHHALARINAKFVQVYILVTNFHDSSMILFFLWSYSNIAMMFYAKWLGGLNLHQRFTMLPTFFWKQTFYICSTPLI
jgi:hypothetical protein